jgi:hypothetical protein
MINLGMVCLENSEEKKILAKGGTGNSRPVFQMSFSDGEIESWSAGDDRPSIL